MRKALWKTVRTQILRLQDGDTLVFHIGDLKRDLLPTEKDLREFRKQVKKEICLDKDIAVAVFPPYVKTSIIRKKRKR